MKQITKKKRVGWHRVGGFILADGRGRAFSSFLRKGSEAE
jgi:hypothetical protein